MQPIPGTVHWDGSGSRGGRQLLPPSRCARVNSGGPTRYISDSFFLQLSEVVLNNFFTLHQVKETRDWINFDNQGSIWANKRRQMKRANMIKLQTANSNMQTFLMLLAYCFIAIFSAVLSKPKKDLISRLADCSKQVQSSFSG